MLISNGLRVVPDALRSMQRPQVVWIIMTAGNAIQRSLDRDRSPHAAYDALRASSSIAALAVRLVVNTRLVERHRAPCLARVDEGDRLLGDAIFVSVVLLVPLIPVRDFVSDKRFHTASINSMKI